MEKVIKLTDHYDNLVDKLTSKIIHDKMSGGPKGTRIIMRNHDTGEILGEYHNKVVISGSIFGAVNAFGVNPSIILPDYNRELNLDNTLDYSAVSPKNTPIVCLFCVGDSGCGATGKDVFKVSAVDRIDPVNDIIPFRYVEETADLDEDLRKYYYGRKSMGDGKVGYYFKSFDTTPMLHLRYTDGTEITDEIYNTETTQSVECYIETRLRINRLDFRDYFEQVLGWDKARISTISLCYAWYDDTIDDHRWYQQIYPYAKLNFPLEWLVDLTKAIDFQYQIFY